MKYLLTLLLLLSLILFSCNKKSSEDERKETEAYSGMQQNELGKMQQDLINVEQYIVTLKQRTTELKEGRYEISDADVKTELELVEVRLNDLNIVHADLKGRIEKTRKELDSLDLLLQK